MVINQKVFCVNDLRYLVRSAVETDAKNLSDVRLQIDGETENLDREPGEAFIDEAGFKQLIKSDTESRHNLFLVAEVDGRIAGFSRCAGYDLKRKAHQVEFGIGILKEFWGYGMGKHLLQTSIQWADENGIMKVVLHVLETNQNAIRLYEKNGFEVEGVLKKDKLLSDGRYYDTVVMGRFQE